MNNEIEPEVDVPEENENAGLPMVVQKQSGPVEVSKATPQQMRVVEVSEALVPAYQKASTLELTDDEIKHLMEPFPDSAVEVRPHDGLIYIPHIHISDRLNRVIKPGKWSLVCRRHWIEGKTMYGEYILLIRGVYVGESVGGHEYQPNNPKTNYSDTLESTAAEALRRIAGKRLSCGSQVWDPTYANEWCSKYRTYANGKYFKSAPKPAAVKRSEAATKPEKAEPSKDPLTKFMTVLEESGLKEQALEFLWALDWLLPTESVSQLGTRYLPKTGGEMKKFIMNLHEWQNSGNAVMPYEPGPIPPPESKNETQKKDENVPRGTSHDVSDPDTDVDEDDTSEWKEFVMPFGDYKGERLGDLDKKYLFGLWANYEVKTEWKGKPRKQEWIDADQRLRDMLDEAGEHYGFEKKD